MKTTEWSQPHTNFFKAVRSLQRALAAGQNARLVKKRNEDCQHPLTQKNSITDFRAYEFSVGLLKSRRAIADDTRMTEFQKFLSLNYKCCYGTQEAVNRYYETGLLSKDNFKGVGVSHLVAVEDLVAYHACLPDEKSREYAQMFASQYFEPHTGDETYFFDHFRLKREHSIYTIKRMKRRVWTIELYHGHDAQSFPVKPLPRFLMWITKPLKYVPQRSVLKMDNYKCVTYRVGDVTNGFAVEFHIPKKFGFN